MSGNVARLSSAASPSHTNPQARARGRRISHIGAGTHFTQVARPQSSPASRGPLNWAPQSRNVRNSVMLPVSRLAAIGNERRSTATAVGSGRWRYAQWIVQSSRTIAAPRQMNQATSHGRSAHGANTGSIHGAYT